MLYSQINQSAIKKPNPQTGANKFNGLIIQLTNYEILVLHNKGILFIIHTVEHNYIYVLVHKENNNYMFRYYLWTIFRLSIELQNQSYQCEVYLVVGGWGENRDLVISIVGTKTTSIIHNTAFFNPSAWGHLNPSSYCDVGRLFYGVFKLWSKLQRKK